MSNRDKPKFTPKPWRRGEADKLEDTFEIRGVNNGTQDYPCPEGVDGVICQCNHWLLQVEANIALIEVAPDMYEELQQASIFLRILADLLDTIIQYDSRKAYRENVLNLGDRIRKRAEKIDTLLARAMGDKI